MASYFGTERRQGSGGTSLLYDPRARGIFYQVVVFGAVIAGIYWIVGNTITNLQRANIASGFGFLYGRAVLISVRRSFNITAIQPMAGPFWLAL